LDKVENKTKELICDTIVNRLSKIGFDIFSITSDNETEFTDHQVIAERLHTEYYFARPILLISKRKCRAAWVSKKIYTERYSY
jgi:IS30 family transposase